MAQYLLTDRQKQIYKYISDYIVKKSYPPTMREIGEAFSLSVKRIRDHIQALERKGYLSYTSSRARSIKLLALEHEEDARCEEMIQLPLLGSVAAGLPIFAEENFEGSFSVAGSMLPKSGEFFALRVAGDSMINAGIFSGDFAIILKQDRAVNGSIVVARTSEGSVTLKRFFKDGNRFKLAAENPEYSPIYSSKVQILGKLCMIIRNY